MTAFDVLIMLAEVVASFLASALLMAGLVTAVGWSVGLWQNALARRHARIEAELDRKQDELRAAIYRLAASLAADARDAQETREAMVRESLCFSHQSRSAD